MKNMFQNFFKGKKILVTGHTGFIGSWLSIWLNELGAKVIGYALPPYTQEDNFVVTKLEQKIDSIIGDIRDFDKINNIFKKYRPEIVFHLAAQPIVRKSFEIPKETYDINVGGTVNIFEAFRKNDFCEQLINITSDKCYENQEWIWGYRENDRLGGYDPYSSSKACSELVTAAYNHSFFDASSGNNQKMVASVRCGNVIGGGDWQEDRLIPDCMRSLRKNNSVEIRNPLSIRPWQYVLEPIRGFLSLSMKLYEDREQYTGSWNFGPDNKSVFCVKDIVNKIIQCLSIGKYVISDKTENCKLHEAKLLLLDCSKSYVYLGWKLSLNIDETIKFVCDWYKEKNINYEFDANQITNYINKTK